MVGAIVGGYLDGDNTMPGYHAFRPGFVGALGVSKQFTFGDGNWFVTGSSAISVAVASTKERNASEEPRYVAGDLRLGVQAGRTFGDMWQPYLLARVFGGPVDWTVRGQHVTGTDKNHYQVGTGLNVVTAFGLTIVLDIVLLGERTFTLGASWRL